MSTQPAGNAGSSREPSRDGGEKSGAVRAWMAGVYREPPRFRVDRLVADGDTRVAIGEITMRDDDGTATTHAYGDVWRLRDGQLAELQAFVI